MDKPVEEILESFRDGDFIDDDRIIDYLLHRLKLAEGERDSVKSDFDELASIVNEKRDGAYKYQGIVQDARLFVYKKKHP